MTANEGSVEMDGGVKSSPHTDEMAKVAECVAPWAEKAIRRDERFRLAGLLYESKATLAGFAGDKRQLVDLISFMLNLDGDAGGSMSTNREGSK